jgi:hypothetical protein
MGGRIDYHIDPVFPVEHSDKSCRLKGENMKLQHVVFLIAVLLLGYFAGVKFPQTGQSLLAKVGL